MIPKNLMNVTVHWMMVEHFGGDVADENTDAGAKEAFGLNWNLKTQ